MDKKIRIASDINNLRIVENEVEEITRTVGVNQDYFGKILVSTLEAVNNAMLHGNKLDEKKFVDIQISFTRKDMKVKVKDEGHGFKPENVPDPTTPATIEEINGRGVFLMSRLADNIKFNKRGNKVTMTFKNILI